MGTTIPACVDFFRSAHKEVHMITVVSMSPAIDKRLTFDSLSLWQTNRVLSTSTEGAGKAIAVALATTVLGLPTHCIGILPGIASAITDRLQRNHVAYTFLDAPGNVRTNLKLYDQRQKKTTELNEPCPKVPAELLAQVTQQVMTYAQRSDYLVLTGSLPEGCTPNWYADIIHRVHMEAPHCRCVLDADGDRLRTGIQAKPWLIKPNIEELQQLSGQMLDGEENAYIMRVLSAAQRLQKDGACIVIASLGEKGAVAVTEAESYYAKAMPIDAITTTSAGDAMVAGLLYGFIKSNILSVALQYGIASATSRCLHASDACIDPTTVHQVFPNIKFSRIR